MIQATIAFSSMPEYFNERINLFVALSPDFMPSVGSNPPEGVSSRWKEVRAASEMLGFYNYLYLTEAMHAVL